MESVNISFFHTLPLYSILMFVDKFILTNIKPYAILILQTKIQRNRKEFFS